MRNFKKYLTPVLILIMISSCKGWLDIQPKGQLIPNTIDDFRKLLDFTGPDNSVSEMFNVTRTYGIADLLGEEFQVTTKAQFDALLPTQPRFHKYCWAQSGTLWQRVDEEDPDMRSLYQKIFLANTVLDGIVSAPGLDTEREQLEGEALVHRTFSYFALVNIWAKAYNPSTASTDLGVPIRNTVILTESLERKTVQQVYDYMIADLQRAIALPNFRWEDPYNHRPTKTAAYAMLSRIYLFMGEYQKSLEAANVVLSHQNFIYNFNTDMVLSTADPRYNATNWPVYGIYKGYSTDDKEVILWKEQAALTTQYSAAYTYMTTNDEYLNSLYNTETDLRFNHYFGGGSSNRYYYIINKRYNTKIYSCVGLTVPEVLLTKAECLARAGNWQEAMVLIEDLRKCRIRTASYAPLEVSDKESALEAIFQERKRELIFHGISFFDVKRRNSLDNANITLTRKYRNTDNEWVVGYSLEPGDDHWQMPFPWFYIQQNPEIEQNPGYVLTGEQ